MKIKIRLYVIVYLLVFLSGCSVPLTQGYTGPVKSEDETAILYIKGDDMDDRYNLNLSSIKVDDYSLSALTSGVVLLPGMHQINFEWTIHDESNSEYGLNLAWKKSGHCQMNFQAQPGQKYLARATVRHEGTWVTDPQIRLEMRDMSSTLSPPLIGEPIVCDYKGRRPGGFFDLSGE